MYIKNLIFSQRQKVADEKNIARIRKEMVKLGQQMAVTMEEYNKVLAINQTIREQLQSEEEKAFKMEESLKVGTFHYSWAFICIFGISTSFEIFLCHSQIKSITRDKTVIMDTVMMCTIFWLFSFNA